MQQRSLLIVSGLVILLVLVVGGTAWWWQSRVLLVLSELPTKAAEWKTLKISVDTGEVAVASAKVAVRFPAGALQIADQDNFGQGIQIIPITDFNSVQEMKIEPTAGWMTMRLYNQGGLKLKGKINLLTFQIKPLQSFTMRLDCAESILYTDYERGETLKARCQGLKVIE